MKVCLIFFIAIYILSNGSYSFALRPSNPHTKPIISYPVTTQTYSKQYIESANVENAVIVKNIKTYNDIFPIIKITFIKVPSSIVAYIFDSNGNSVGKLFDDVQSRASYKTKYEAKIFFDSNLYFNGNYYVKLIIKWGDDEGRIYHMETLKYDIKIAIPGREIGEGFFIFSPNSRMRDLGDTGTYYMLTDRDVPVVAWLDTINKNVVKYQFFIGSPDLNPGLKPLIDNIPANKRIIELSSLRNEAEYSGLIRAIMKDGSYKDTEEFVTVHSLKMQMQMQE